MNRKKIKNKKEKKTNIPQPLPQKHLDAVNKIQEFLKTIYPEIDVKNMTDLFNIATFKMHLDSIKKRDDVLFIVCKNIKNSPLFSSYDKDIGVFFRNRHIFFDSDIDITDLQMPLIHMINGDNADNKCNICNEIKASERTMPCVSCGKLMCYPCVNKIMASVGSDNVLKCPMCNKKGVEFNTTTIDL